MILVSVVMHMASHNIHAQVIKPTKEIKNINENMENCIPVHIVCVSDKGVKTSQQPDGCL